MDPIPNAYARYVARSLSSMGDFHVHEIWAHSAATCDLTAKLREKTRPQDKKWMSQNQIRPTVRIAPVLVVIIVCIFLCPQILNRQLSSKETKVESYTMRVAKMAECQYGCTGSTQYETCVVGCVEIMTETECKASILCQDCPLAFPEPHSFAKKCQMHCSNE